MTSDQDGAGWNAQEGAATEGAVMGAPRIIGRLFRVDGNHITDLKISGQPAYFEASAYAVPEAAMYDPCLWAAASSPDRSDDRDP
jgi:hypothetical protein